jgi:prepilin-type N-terminal cleavage/methylation domain-containing protein
MRTRKNQRGFSLIELGIVIAVIAVLTTVVLVGRGFILSARTSKVVEALDSIAKSNKVYAGQFGGVFPTTDNDIMNNLSTRMLLPAGNGWTPVTGFSFARVRAAAGSQEWLIEITCPDNPRCQDIWNQKNTTDPTMIKANNAINGVTCHGTAAPTTGTQVNLCFQL